MVLLILCSKVIFIFTILFIYLFICSSRDIKTIIAIIFITFVLATISSQQVRHVSCALPFHDDDGRLLGYKNNKDTKNTTIIQAFFCDLALSLKYNYDVNNQRS